MSDGLQIYNRDLSPKFLIDHDGEEIFEIDQDLRRSYSGRSSDRSEPEPLNIADPYLRELQVYTSVSRYLSEREAASSLMWKPEARNKKINWKEEGF